MPIPARSSQSAQEYRTSRQECCSDLRCDYNYDRPHPEMAPGETYRNPWPSVDLREYRRQFADRMGPVAHWL